MKKKLLFFGIIVALCAAGLWAGSSPPNAKNEHELRYVLTPGSGVLLGVEGVHVRVLDLPPEAEALNLTKEHIQRDVELRLRRNGIKVLPPGQPLLIVNVNVTFGGSQVAYSVDISLQEHVFLRRDPETVVVNATTWSKGAVGICPRTDIKQIRESVKDYVDEFSNDYLAVNTRN